MRRPVSRSGSASGAEQDNPGVGLLGAVLRSWWTTLRLVVLVVVALLVLLVGAGLGGVTIELGPLYLSGRRDHPRASSTVTVEMLQGHLRLPAHSWTFPVEQGITVVFLSWCWFGRAMSVRFRIQLYSSGWDMSLRPGLFGGSSFVPAERSPWRAGVWVWGVGDGPYLRVGGRRPGERL